MSILIKSMEMPKNCWDCACYYRKVDSGYYDYEICRASGTIFNDGYSSITGHKDHIDPFKARLDNCPLVLVPPHGRLIDADKLKEEFPHDEDWDYPVNTNSYVVEIIDKSPTIIEAEESE